MVNAAHSSTNYSYCTDKLLYYVHGVIMYCVITRPRYSVLRQHRAASPQSPSISIRTSTSTSASVLLSSSRAQLLVLATVYSTGSKKGHDREGLEGRGKVGILSPP
jgi:hypothetical protein